jgi:adenylate cyclase class IV
MAEPVPGINLEFKARLADRRALESALRRLGAHRDALLRQRDTYFHVTGGRLKLREQGGATELIAYQRTASGPAGSQSCPDAASHRWSRYTRTPVADAAECLASLTAAHGLRGVVTKLRRVWLYENARIHIDDVDGLGQFAEIEIVDPQSEKDARAQLAALLLALGLDPTSAISGSYIDLLENELTDSPLPWRERGRG